jgi:hypothetical protein
MERHEVKPSQSVPGGHLQADRETLAPSILEPSRRGSAEDDQSPQAVNEEERWKEE